jgi:hypothetical protein
MSELAKDLNLTIGAGPMLPDQPILFDVLRYDSIDSLSAALGNNSRGIQAAVLSSCGARCVAQPQLRLIATHAISSPLGATFSNPHSQWASLKSVYSRVLAHQTGVEMDFDASFSELNLSQYAEPYIYNNASPTTTTCISIVFNLYV